MKITIIKTQAEYRVSITATLRKDFLETAEQLRKIIPTKYRRFDLDDMCWTVQHRAVKYLEDFLSRQDNAQIDRREDIQLTPADRVRTAIKERMELHKLSA